MASIAMRLVVMPVTAVMLSLTGCQGTARGVAIPPGADDLAPCPVTQIPVDRLSDVGDPECDLAGTSLTFADETLQFAVGPPSVEGTTTLTIPSVGAVFSQGDGQGRELLIVNWGVPGVGVAAIEEGRLIAIWATGSHALELQRQQLAVENVEVD